MKDSVLVLGVGNSRKHIIQLGASQQEADTLGPYFENNFRKVVTIDIDPAVKPDYLHDLTVLPWPVESEAFDEVHAYEVLEHLTPQGDYVAFFSLWKEIWRVLKPNGLVCASTPWWESMWVWQDPGHKLCYSPGLLTYLSQSEYTRQIGTTSMTDYRKFFPPPYDFQAKLLQMVGQDPKFAGFRFALQKKEASWPT